MLSRETEELGTIEKNQNILIYESIIKEDNFHKGKFDIDYTLTGNEVFYYLTKLIDYYRESDKERNFEDLINRMFSVDSSMLNLYSKERLRNFLLELVELYDKFTSEECESLMTGFITTYDKQSNEAYNISAFEEVYQKLYTTLYSVKNKRKYSKDESFLPRSPYPTAISTWIENLFTRSLEEQSQCRCSIF